MGFLEKTGSFLKNSYEKAAPAAKNFYNSSMEDFERKVENKKKEVRNECREKIGHYETLEAQGKLNAQQREKLHEVKSDLQSKGML